MGARRGLNGPVGGGRRLPNAIAPPSPPAGVERRRGLCYRFNGIACGPERGGPRQVNGKLESKMAYVVTENCVKCKFQDCVEVCPVDCYYEGENFLVINPDECIDCGVCEPECPAEAIVPDSDPRAADWIEVARKFAGVWPSITRKGDVPADAEEWKGKPGKAALLSEKPAR